jgi:RHS repeat-associated protein
MARRKVINNVNQIVNSTGPERVYTHDDDGGMTQGHTPEGYAFTATYDAEGRLTSIEYEDSGSVLHRTEYTYGGDSLLYQIRKLEDGVETSVRRIIRAGFLPIQERDGNNQVVREYVWGIDMGGGIGGLLAMREGGADYYYLYDGKGNVTALTDSSGTVVATYSYDPFGVLMEKTGTLDQPFRFSTKRYDEDTGLSYYGFRFYSASLGRWITRDPLGEAGGINLYGFVGNNAINGIDPLGLQGIVVRTGLSRSKFDNALSRLPRWTRNIIWGIFTDPIPTAGMCSVRKFTPNQAALIDIAKAAKRKGITRDEAAILKNWAREYNIPFRGPEKHLNRNFQDIHLHIGPVDKIPVRQ